jgi:hypothetical protein
MSFENRCRNLLAFLIFSQSLASRWCPKVPWVLTLQAPQRDTALLLPGEVADAACRLAR